MVVAFPLHGKCRGFKSLIAYHVIIMNKIRINNKTYVDVSRPFTKKEKKSLKNARPAKKHFCYNLFWKKLTIGLWGIPDTKYKKYPKISYFNFTSYTKLGVSWKKLLFEIVWNKRAYPF